MSVQIWKQASELAAQTPAARNRYVDFLRAVSILVVILGHWLISTIYFVDGSLVYEHIFKVQPATRWLTWLFQVMPIFFIVGGYSNAVSLESAKRKGIGYGGWLALRLNRLVIPLLALVIAWATIALAMHLLGADPAVIQLASQTSLIPTWFLAIYIMVVILAPLTYRLWQRFGFAFLWSFIAIAVLMDFLFFALSIRWPGWSNYFWVWLSVHNLGYAWRDGRIGSAGQLLAGSAGALAILCLLVFVGPYPMAMVGSPGQTLSNNTPPKITLLALAMFQFGILMTLEKPMRRLLEGLRLWTATVLINGMIMTIYLWHSTVMILFIAMLYFAGGAGLALEPGSAAWWLSRPFWFVLLTILLIPISLAISPLERISRNPEAAISPPPRQVAGAMMICLGVALLALFGYGGGPALDLAGVGLVIAGAGIGGLLAGFKSVNRRSN
jgi:hypothetical protein